MARVVREHAAVVAAIEDHDADRAAAAMEGHLDGLQISMEDIRCGVMFVVLMLVTYILAISLWLPHLLKL